MQKLIKDAIENKQVLEFQYDGGIRVVEPHCLGITSKGNTALRAFQVDGYSSSGSLGWKLFDIANANAIKVLDNFFLQPREGYKKGDKGMREIIVEI